MLPGAFVTGCNVRRMAVQGVDAFAFARSLLFVPGDRPERVEKAIRSDADAVIIDLEDAVVPAAKPAARGQAADLLASREPARPVAVRVNGAGTEWFEDDVAAAASAGADVIVLPKAEPELLETLPAACPPVLALVESAEGLAGAERLARHPLVVRLVLGPVDLALELGLARRRDGLELLVPRSALVLASALAGRPPPVDGPWVELDDEQGLRDEASLARSLGFGGKLCLHPRQLGAVNEAFSPSEDEVRRAAELVSAFDAAAAEGTGVVSVGGTMVDRPVVEQARRLLERVGHDRT